MNHSFVTRAIVTLSAAALASACSDPVGPATGSLTVLVTVTDGELNSSQLAFALNDGAEQSFGLAASHTIAGLEPRTYSVRITRLPPRCRVVGANPQATRLDANEKAVVWFRITCEVDDGRGWDYRPQSAATRPGIHFDETAHF